MPYLLTRNKKKDFSARIQLPDASAVIGRTSDAGVRIEDQSVSKVHAKIEPLADGRFRLTDMGSRNGIFFKGKRFKKIEVGIGDELKLGNVTITLCGEEKTLPIPDLAEAPPRAPDETQAPPSTTSSVGMLLNTSERRLLVVFVLLLVGLGAVFFLLPGDKSGAKDNLASTTDPEDTTDPNSSTGNGVGDSSGASDDTDVVAERIPRKTEPEPKKQAPRTAPLDRDAWSALAVTLDQNCSNAGCHTVTADVDFRLDGGEDLGRWERNLLELRSRTTISKGDDGWQVGAFARSGPHQKPMALALDPSAEKGVEVWTTASGRLLAADPERPPFEMLHEFKAEEIRRLRRAWLILYDRVPTIDEIYVHGSRKPVDLLEEARSAPEFWRARARRELRGRGGFDSRGNFDLPATLLPDQVPASPSDWAGRLTRVIDGTRTRTSVPYRSEAPLPADNDEDLAFRGWFLNALGEPPRPLAPDVYLDSVWCALWGRPPSMEEAQLLRESLAPELGWPELRRAIVSLVAHAPRTPTAPSPGEADAVWVSGVMKYFLGTGVAQETCEEVAARVRDGRLDARVLLEECLLSKEWEYD